MASRNSAAPLLVATGIVLLGVWLSSQPDCDDGCQNIAHALIRHGFGMLG